MTQKIERIWQCKIGGLVEGLPNGADSPMRDAIEKAFREVTGYSARFTFSGWAAELTEGERQVVNNDCGADACGEA